MPPKGGGESQRAVVVFSCFFFSSPNLLEVSPKKGRLTDPLVKKIYRVGGLVFVKYFATKTLDCSIQAISL